MVKRVDTALVRLWGEVVGAVSWLADRGHGVFEYDRAFLKKNLDISPIHMGLDDARQGDGTYAFPALNVETFLGLPGLLADALPDKFGNRIIDAWLARQGRDAAGFSPVERLCYTGKRAMGALEFSPAIIDKHERSVPVEIAELVELAQQIMTQRDALDARLDRSDKETPMPSWTSCASAPRRAARGPRRSSRWTRAAMSCPARPGRRRGTTTGS